MPIKVMIVDDDLESLKLIGLMLQRRGYAIVAAQSGTQALSKAEAESPDLVILDVMMPDMDGYEVCRRLRANPRVAHIPIIMFTAKTMVGDKVAGFQAGADDYLTKPIHPAELASRVEALLQRVGRGKAQAVETPIKARTVAFLGAKGGLGTTMLAINVGVALLRNEAKGRRVVVTDLVPGAASVGLQLGLRRLDGMGHLLERQVADLTPPVLEAQLAEHASKLLALPGQLEPCGVAAPLTADVAEAIVRHLGGRSDFLLLDLGTGLGDVNKRVLPLCQRVVVTVEPERTCLTLAQSLLEHLQRVNVPSHRVSVVLINKARSATSFTRDAIEALLQRELIGIVPPAPELAFQSIEQGMPMVMAQPESLVAMQIQTVAKEIAKS